MSEPREWKAGDTTLHLNMHVQPEWSPGTLYIGARLLHRAMSRGIALAVHLAGRADESALTKVQFVDSEAQACELIARMRTERLAKVA